MYSYLQKYYHGSDINESVITLEASLDCLLLSSVLAFLTKILFKYTSKCAIRGTIKEQV
jgi:hypothetical protein